MQESKHLKSVNNTDILLGKHPESGLEIYTGVSKYGPYVKILQDDEGKKWRYAPLKDIKQDDITIEAAMEVLKYPKMLGKIGNAQVYLHKGQYGLYLKKANDTMSIKDKEIDENDINIKYAKKLFSIGDPYALKSYTIKNKTVNLKKGQYGYYLQIKGSGKKKTKNLSLPNSINPDTLTIEEVLEYIAKVNGTKKKYSKKD
jgi:DNA topoisomerase-1